MKLASKVCGAVAGVAILAALSALSQAPAAPPAYRPGLGDLMNTSMQVHHVKLGLAGAHGDWPLAAYEVKELGETVEDIKTYSPTWNNIPVGAMSKSVLPPAIASVSQAIAAKNATSFAAAYRQLTNQCNSCHAAAGQPEIHVTVPSAAASAAFPDQTFTPAVRSAR